MTLLDLMYYFNIKAILVLGVFFAHWSFYKYFRTLPFVFQVFTNPINSIYLSAALAKTLIQLMLIITIAAYIYFSQVKTNRNFLFSMILITPLFQTEGFNRYMNIIDKSIVYSFFYPLFLGFLAIYFLFFFKYLYNEQKMKINLVTQIFLISLSFIISFSSPLNPGIILIVCPMVLLHAFYTHFQSFLGESFLTKIYHSLLKIDRNTFILFLIIVFFSLYSLFLSRSHAENSIYELSLMQRYARIPAGLYYIIFSKLGFPLLILLTMINVFLLRKQAENLAARKILSLMKWITIFAFIYVLLLPLGGARVYRPNIIRGDTFMPVTLAMIFIYAISTHFLINTLTQKAKKGYLVGVVLFLLLFTISDEPIINTNACERSALNEIAASNDSVVVLRGDCPVLAWDKFEKPEQSTGNSLMLQYWGITKKMTLYYHAKAQ